MELVVALAYYFKQIISSNMDLFYIIAIFLILKDIFNKKINIITRGIIILYPIIILTLIQILFFNYINITKLIINVIKIYICVYILIFTKTNLFKYDIRKIISYVSLMFTISIPISLILSNNNILWRLNDKFNEFSNTRLRLFYYEPSELAFYVSIIIIFLFYYLLKDSFNNRKYKFYIISLSTVLYLTKAMSAIAFVILSLSVMYINYTRKNISPKKIVIFISVSIICAIFIVIFFNSESQLLNRLNSILSGKDGSANYRIKVGFDILKSALVNSNGIGIGLGNLNTPYIQNIYSKYGMVEIISNSFMYFFAEGGILAILYLGLFLVYSIVYINKKKSFIRYGLFLFIILYQITGGYFTNPVNWIIYGIILSETKFENNFKNEGINYEKVISY